MSGLPIDNIVDELLHVLQQQQQVILQAPPGAGKSTSLPLNLLAQPWLTGKILMLEPRRLAARSVASRLASQLQQKPGESIGYRMRADSCVSQQTRLEVITEGILTRRLQQDPLLDGVSLVILDEFHERSLQTDLALTLLLDIQQGLRDDLKLLIMSATLDNQGLSRLLPQAPLICSEGRSYPVHRHYVSLPTQKSLDEAIIASVTQIMTQHQGSLLVFLPGVAEIKRTEQRLSQVVADDTDIFPLYGALPIAQQQQAIMPTPLGRRKIVLATNIAETSLTIEGIHLVVDSALERVAQFDIRTGITKLVTQKISKAAMIQRSGRAGRLAPGVCWHLLSQDIAERAAEQNEPEIVHSDLTSLWFELLNWGCHDVQQLQWLTQPPSPAINYAQRLLAQLKLIDRQGNLTARGKQAALLPCEPRLAAMLVYASERGTRSLATALVLVAILEEPPKQGSSDLSDWLLTPLPHWLKRAKQLAKRWPAMNAQPDIADIPYILLAGFPDRIAKQRGQPGYYQLANGSGAYFAESEPLAVSDWLIAPGLLQSEQMSSARILLASSFDPTMLAVDFADLVTENIGVEWQAAQGTLQTIKRQQIGSITIQQTRLTRPSQQQLTEALLDWVRQSGLAKLNWSQSANQLRIRLMLAKQWLPDFNWPSVTDEDLLANLSLWLAPALENISDVRGLQAVDLVNCLHQLLDWQQKQQLDQLLPTTYQVPTGTIVPIIYSLERSPQISVKLQEMFGEQDSPKVAHGQLTVAVELLSPAARPLQITSNLLSFWQGAYQDVKKEMRGRYPKHVWPDDPINSKPTRKTKKYQD